MLSSSREQLLERIGTLDERRAAALLQFLDAFERQPATDARTAQRKANGWLVDHVGNMVMGDRPRLVNQGRVWRVPALITSPRRAPFGPIGWVDVDATTGQVLADEQVIQELADNGQHHKCAPLPTGE